MAGKLKWGGCGIWVFQEEVSKTVSWAFRGLDWKLKV